METYLLNHNITIFDFSLLLILWIIGTLIFIFGWMGTYKLYKFECENGHFHNLITWLGMIVYTIWIGPIYFCGFWHFLNMILNLYFGFNLYWD